MILTWKYGFSTKNSKTFKIMDSTAMKPVESMILSDLNPYSLTMIY
jgi:hypothetical protein